MFSEIEHGRETHKAPPLQHNMPDTHTTGTCTLHVSTQVHNKHPSLYTVGVRILPVVKVNSSVLAAHREEGSTHCQPSCGLRMAN